MSDQYQPTFTAHDAHQCVTVEAVAEMVNKGTTEKRAVAVILNQAGYTNQAGGDAFGDLFGAAVKSGGFGNLVTGGKDDLGIARERGTTGTKAKAVAVDPVQGLRDQLDRERTLLESVTAPVTEAEEAIDTLDNDPGAVIEARQTEIADQVKALQTEAKQLKTAEGASAYVDAMRERMTARVDSARTAAGEREKVHAENIERLEQVLTALDAVNAPA